MNRQASSLLATTRGLLRLPRLATLGHRSAAVAARQRLVLTHGPQARTFTATATHSGPWLGDPYLDGAEKIGHTQLPLGLAADGRRKQTLDIHPTGWESSKEERFRLSTLDLFNTQNYSTHALIFKLAEAEKPHVLEALKCGLEDALGQCRHMVGTVERNEHGDFSIVKKPDSTINCVLQWLDDGPSYSDLEKAGFTSQSLGDPARLTIEGMTMGCRRPPDSSPAVTGFQLNLIPGGLIFTIHKHHAAIDIAGTTSLVHQIAGNCHSILKGTPRPSWDEAYMDRSRFVSNVAQEAQVDPPPAPGRHPDWLPCSWLLFHLPKSKAAELKQLAMPEDGTWISTHDALTAFLWRVISKHRARIYRPDLGSPALLFEAINMRDRCK